MPFSFFKKKPDTFDYEESRTCRCCNNMFKGRYCNICGEKVIEPSERSFLAFLDNLLNAFTFLDGKFITSLKLLVTRPGQLSRNIADGLRVPYMKMISLFFVANFFYFLFPIFDSFNSTLFSQTNLMGEHSVRAKAIVEKEVSTRQISIEEFEEKYRAQSTNLSKLLLIVLVLVMAVTHLVINFSKKNYFFDHLLISMEFYSFHLLINMLLLPAIGLLLVRMASWVGWNWNSLLTDRVFSVPVYGLVLYFLIRAQRIFYNHKWYWAIPKAIILFYAFREVISLYRIMLFYITVWTI
ncbi:MAG: DUF3667 domain-containing protein [Cyclobacteriaceae bacterium]|nr:DUF3667 domain-containing protein [Cyclobacteriaceae bacterium]